MNKKVHKQIYRMREKGVDSTVFNDVVQEEFESADIRPEDVIWDDDVLMDVDDDSYYQNANIKRKKFDDFRNVGNRHY
ncbi:MAG: hypothetical protein ACO1OC_11965 [Tuberibacillus sp.]